MSERGIVFRFGIYFDEIVKLKYPNLSVDSEYNRNINIVKKLPNRQEGSYPDLILHKRGSNDNNVIVIEFKSWWNRNQCDDRRKVEFLCEYSGEYGYKYGGVVLLAQNRKDVEVNVFYNGKWTSIETLL